MKVELTIKKVFDVKYLRVSAKPRYWENTEINGVHDSKNGFNIPCKEGENWCPFIVIDTGEILNWEKGKTASIHYKVCDEGSYTLIGNEEVEIKEIEGYVPSMMSPKGNGYGDYIIMDIDENGFIQNWDPSFEEFDEEDDY